MLSPAPRILITRLSALGDTVLTLPVLCALRRAFPAAQIGWVAEPAAAKVLADRTDLNFLFTVEKGWLTKLSEVARLRKSLQRHQFEIVIDAQGLTKSAVAGWLSGRAEQITFTRGEAREVAPTLARTRVQPTATYVAQRYLQLLAPLGIENPRLEFQMPYDSVAHDSIAGRVKRIASGRYAVLNVGAGWYSKTWLPTRFGEVAADLFMRYELPSVLLWGNDTEYEYAEQAAQTARSIAPHCVTVLPKLSIAEMKEAIRHAKLLISGDTGPLHFGVALDTPTISLFGVTKAEYYSPNRGIHRTVQNRYEPLSSRKRRRAGNEAMQAIDTVDVLSQVDSLLAMRHSKAA
ncbi:lipopolysaccharide heptosyltransferase family protein [Bremerella cremea]|uniref:Lipopolysaccharide heptosyltransferase family protein n=1 Tax=Bremerella cremea TaxID=1031537 RepID=A0A368KK19_9BACT|nr:glycosyltransferase family 9 protein [Bremerella cremea]RCS41118.1 lipopolysaccharide heptosyltransferase family protein [Bremerella cremea]